MYNLACFPALARLETPEMMARMSLESSVSVLLSLYLSARTIARSEGVMVRLEGEKRTIALLRRAEKIAGGKTSSSGRGRVLDSILWSCSSGRALTFIFLLLRGGA